MVRTFDSTRLQALNEILLAVGEAPVISENAQTIEVVGANQILEMVEREVQGIGWHWNVELDLPVDADSAGKFPLPADIIRMDPITNRYSGKILVKRGAFIYDTRNRTYVITNLTQIKVDIVRFLEWDEVPEEVRRLCMVRAGRILQDRMVGSDRHHRWSLEDENRAWWAVELADSEVGDRSIFTDPSLGQILFRGRAPLRDIVSDQGGFSGGEGGGGLPAV